MKKPLHFLFAIPLLMLFSFQCSKEEFEGNIYTGKVTLEGICGRTVISIIDGDLGLLPTGSYAPRWTDPNTGIQHENVFMIGNICQIDSTLRLGDQFTFTLHDQPNRSCIVCMAWSPAPQEQMAIKLQSLLRAR